MHFYNSRKDFPGSREEIDLEFRLIQESVYKEPSIIRRGLYYQQISAYLKHFDVSQLLVLRFYELTKQPVEACNAVLEFLQIEEKLTSLNLEIKNKKPYDFVLDEADKKLLQEFYNSNKTTISTLGKGVGLVRFNTFAN